jgi:hypothetical protein
MSETDPLLQTSPTDQHESGYESIPQPTQEPPNGDHNSNRIDPQRQTDGLVVGRRRWKCCLVCTVVSTVILALLIPVIIGCTAYFRNKNAACYSAVPQVSVHTRSDAYSFLYWISALSCFGKPIGVEVLLGNEAASVEIDQILCESIEKRHFQNTYNKSGINLSVNQPAPVFSEDFSSQNYFLSGGVQVDMVGITTIVLSVGVELCLFTNNDDFKAFLTAGANWRSFIGNAECHLVRVKSGGSNSTIFRISEPTFAFVGIVTTGNNISIGNLTITANGVEVSGTGENATKVCQLNGKHPTCSFRVVNNEREDFCLVAHEEEHSDGSYDYSKLTIKFHTKHNIRFWVCLSILLVHISLTTIFYIALIRWFYKRWKRGRSVIAQETRKGSSFSTLSVSEQTIQTSEQQQVCTAPHAPGDQLTTNENQPPERDIETPPEELRLPIKETHKEPTCTPIGPSVVVSGIQTAVESECTFRIQDENDGQSDATTPIGNATEPNTQESLRQPDTPDQDTQSSEALSSPIFSQSIPVQERNNT